MNKKYWHHRYEWENPFNSIRHNWKFSCQDGGLNFHVAENDKYGDSAGLEIHKIVGKGSPDHLNCPITGGRCYYDGTSLYATETLWPIIKLMAETNDHKQIFKILENEADRIFNQGEDEDESA